MHRFLFRFLTVVLVFFGMQAQALFLSPDDWDPSIPGVGTNRYAYSGGDPINLVDPGGHVPHNPGGSNSEGLNNQDEEDEYYTSWTDHDDPDYEEHNYESPEGNGPLGNDRVAGVNFGVTVLGTQSNSPERIDHEQVYLYSASGAAISADDALYGAATLGAGSTTFGVLGTIRLGGVVVPRSLSAAAVPPLTNAVTRTMARSLGYIEVRGSYSHGQLVFQRGSRLITRDVDSHSGGVWKLLDRNGQRLATLDADLNPIGP